METYFKLLRVIGGRHFGPWLFLAIPIHELGGLVQEMGSIIRCLRSTIWVPLDL